MAMEIDKLGYAGIGVLAKMQDLIESFVEGREPKEEEASDEKKTVQERMDELTALGEERYATWQDKSKEEREKFSEKFKERASKVFNELGLVTKEDLEDLDAKIRKLSNSIKKASADKK